MNKFLVVILSFFLLGASLNGHYLGNKMQDLNDFIPGGTLTSAQFNEIPSEIQQVIIDMGIVLSGADLTQLAKGIAGYAAASTFYLDIGAANAYVLDPISSKQGLPNLSQNTNGALVRFTPTNINTGVTTVNVNGLGVKSLRDEDGENLVGGEIILEHDVWMKWDNAGGVFRIFDWNIFGRQLVSHGTQVTTSGTSKDFLNIPAWVKRLTVSFDQVGASGSDDLLVQIGDAGGIETSGYIGDTVRVSTGAGVTSASTSGYIVRLNGSANITGMMTIILNGTSTIWVASHTLRGDAGEVIIGGGRKAITASPLDRVKILLTGANTFNNGQVNVHYE